MTTPQSEASRRAFHLKESRDVQSSCREKGHSTAPIAGERLISRAELRHFVNISDMGLWRWLQTGKFVRPVYIGTRRYWRQSEIERWLEQRSAAS